MTELNQKTDKRFVWGATLTIIGYLLILNPYWWIFGTPLVLVSGVIFIGSSNKSRSTKIWFSVTPFLMWFPGFLALMYFGTNHAAPKTYLIPKDFRGKITIFYGEPCGIPSHTKNGRLIYNIPKTGILIVKDSADYGILNEEYYFVDSKGNRMSNIDMLNEQDSIKAAKQKVGRYFPSGTNQSSDAQTGLKGFISQTIYITTLSSFKNYNDRTGDSVAKATLQSCRAQH